MGKELHTFMIPLYVSIDEKDLETVKDIVAASVQIDLDNEEERTGITEITLDIDQAKWIESKESDDDEEEEEDE